MKYIFQIQSQFSLFNLLKINFAYYCSKRLKKSNKSQERYFQNSVEVPVCRTFVKTKNFSEYRSKRRLHRDAYVFQRANEFLVKRCVQKFTEMPEEHTRKTSLCNLNYSPERIEAQDPKRVVYALLELAAQPNYAKPSCESGTLANHKQKGVLSE